MRRRPQGYVSPGTTYSLHPSHVPAHISRSFCSHLDFDVLARLVSKHGLVRSGLTLSALSYSCLLGTNAVIRFATSKQPGLSDV
jgi:hypothetical protein